MNEEWQEGRQAYVDGDDESDCPYRTGVKRMHWLEGYSSAQDEDDTDDRIPD